MSGLLLSQIPLWQQHEDRAIEVVLKGLALLVSDEGKNRLREEVKNTTDNWEDQINRVFFFCLNKANRYLQRDGRGVPSGFLYESRNQPDPDAASRLANEYKRCDIRTGYFDNNEPNDFQGSRYFDIECKRLGSPTSPTWVLNREYVQNGIMRFVSIDHAYGNGVPSGSMIGYVENMNLADVLAEVNTNTSSEGISGLTLTSTWLPDNVFRLGHKFNRSITVSPFLLHHFWLDVRTHFEEFRKERSRGRSKLVTPNRQKLDKLKARR